MMLFAAATFSCYERNGNWPIISHSWWSVLFFFRRLRDSGRWHVPFQLNGSVHWCLRPWSHPNDHLECYSLPALSFKTADGHVSASPRSKQVQHDAAFVVHTLSIACLVRGHCCSCAARLNVGFSPLTSNIEEKVNGQTGNCNERSVMPIGSSRETSPVLIEQGLQ